MNYVDKVIKKPYHDKTIVIIICARNNKYVIEYWSDERIFAREFKITREEVLKWIIMMKLKKNY